MRRTVIIDPLLKAIQNIDDDMKLLELYQYLGLSPSYEHVLSKEELAEINEAEREIENGEFKTHEQVIEKARKWIKSNLVKEG